MNFTRERQEIQLTVYAQLYPQLSSTTHFILTISYSNYSTSFLLSPFSSILANGFTFFNEISEVMQYILLQHLCCLPESSPVPAPIFCPVSPMISKYSLPISVSQPIHLISLFPDSSKSVKSVSQPPTPQYLLSLLLQRILYLCLKICSFSHLKEKSLFSPQYSYS